MRWLITTLVAVALMITNSSGRMKPGARAMSANVAVGSKNTPKTRAIALICAFGGSGG